jgi:transposase
MLSLPSTVRVFVATAPCDLRKQFDGIAVLIQQSLRHDPRSGHLFVVFNRRGDQVRILFWDRQGYCLFANQLASHCTSCRSRRGL